MAVSWMRPGVYGAEQWFTFLKMHINAFVYDPQ